MRRKRILTIFTTMMCASLLFGCGNKEQDSAAAGPESGQENAAEIATDTGTENVAGAGETANSGAESESAGADESGASAADLPEEDAGPDYDKIYGPILSEVIGMITEGYDYEMEYDYFSTGIMERIMYPGDDDLMQTIGYVMEDINGDGVKELLIGEDNNFEYESEDIRNFVYSGYTVKDDKAVCFLEAWSRNRQHYMGNGHFYNSGSSSAWSSCIGEWHLEPGGAEITWDDFYFSEEDVANGGLAIFHNTTGIWDMNQAERVDMSDDAFYSLSDQYESVKISWTPLAEALQSGLTSAAKAPLSEQELKSLEKKLNDDGYYGFLLGYFSNPQDIYWADVFYDGAGIDAGYPSDEVLKAYLKATGEEEIYTDLTAIKGKDLEAYVKATTGYAYSEMSYPLDDWVYLKDYDLYLFQHGDTNRAEVDVISGYLQDGMYHITYDGSYGDRNIVGFTEEGDTLRFAYNLPEWFVLDPVGGGDVDQSTLTDGMIFPDSDVRKLTEEDLKGLTAEELRIARNEIYARHGRRFKDETLQAYFDALPWYFGSVDPADFDESVLNEYERANLKFISDFEKEQK